MFKFKEIGNQPTGMDILTHFFRTNKKKIGTHLSPVNVRSLKQSLIYFVRMMGLKVVWVEGKSGAIGLYSLIIPTNILAQINQSGLLGGIDKRGLDIWHIC